MKTILFTHNDLDGISCAVVAKLFDKDVEVHYCTYSNVTETIKNRLAELTEKCLIIISDLSYPEVEKDITIELLAKHNTYVVDHHPTSTWMNNIFKLDKDNYADCQADGDFCGSTLLYCVLNSCILFDEDVTERLKHFLFLVNAWDTWEWVKEESLQGDIFKSKSLWLHNCHKCWGTDVFVSQMVPWIKYGYGDIENFLTNNQQISVVRYQERQKNEVERTLKTARPASLESQKYGHLNFIYMDDEGFNPSLVSLVANMRGLDNGYDFIAIKPKDQLSLRYPKGDLDLSIIAKELGGGGHKVAAGVPWSSEVENKITWQ